MRNLAIFLTSPSGRIGRKSFWLFLISSYFIFFGSLFLVEFYFKDVFIISTPLMVLALFAHFTHIIIWIKRLHDRNHSGYTILIGIIPIAGLAWLFIQAGILPGNKNKNKYRIPGSGEMFRY